MFEREDRKTIVKIILDILIFIIISFIVMCLTDNIIWGFLTGLLIKKICETLNKMIDE